MYILCILYYCCRQQSVASCEGLFVRDANDIFHIHNLHIPLELNHFCLAEDTQLWRHHPASSNNAIRRLSQHAAIVPACHASNIKASKDKRLHLQYHLVELYAAY